MKVETGEDPTIVVEDDDRPATSDEVLVKAADRYVLLERVGEGGMGEVFEAYDTKLDRRVALKFVRVDKRKQNVEAQAALLHEAKALARLSHPNVVTVFDAGVHENRMFVAMEFVDGQTIADWYTDEPRDWREVVELMVQAGRGLQAAHAHGLIHRDFKPGNVMVSNTDGRLRARVLDFGIAVSEYSPTKSYDSLPSTSSPDLRVVSVHSNESTSIVGTPAFMAPEQFDGRLLDERCDQFAFCVVLYRLVYGEDPFEKGAGRRAAVLEGKVREPRRISGVPARLRTTILRGLAADPADRYPAVDALLADLERALGEKRRRRLIGVVAAGTAFVGFASFSAAQTDDGCGDFDGNLAGVWDEARREQADAAFSALNKTFADEAWTSAEKHLDGFSQAWVEARTDVCESTRRPDITTARIEQQQACLRHQLVVAGALVDVFAEADVEVARHAVEAAAQLPAPATCLQPDPLSGFMEPPPAVHASRIEEIQGDLAETQALMVSGQWAAALDSATTSLESAQATGYRPLIAEAYTHVAQTRTRQAQIPQGRAAYDAALREASASGAVDAQAAALTGLCNIYGLVDNDKETGLLLCGQAEALLEKLGNPTEQLAQLRVIRATMLFKTGSFEESEVEFEAALELTEQLPSGHRIQISARSNLAAMLGTKGDHKGAARVAKEGAQWLEDNFGAHHPLRATMLTSIGAAAHHGGNLEEATAAFEEALKIARDAFGDEQPETAVLFQNLGLIYMESGDNEAAYQTMKRALELKRSIYGKGNVSTAHTANNVGAVLFELGRHEEAIERAEEAIDIWTDKLGADAAIIAIGLDTKLRALRALEMPIDLDVVDRMVKVADGEGLDPAAHAEVEFLAAELVDALAGDRPRARALAESAIDRFESSQTDPGEKTDEMRAWLEAHPGT